MKVVKFIAVLVVFATLMVSCGGNGTGVQAGGTSDSVVSPGVKDTLVADTLTVSPDTLK